jgi:hypothetical protein
MTLPLPPLLYAPIYDQAVGKTVYVTGVLPNSEVFLSATPPFQPNGTTSVVGHATSQAGGNVWVPLSVALTPEQTVTATQTNSGDSSAASNPIVVQERPKILPPPVFLSELSTCMGSLRMGGLVEGCTLHITAAGTQVLNEVATQPILSVQAFQIASSVTIHAGAVLEAWQTFGGSRPSATTTSTPVVSSAGIHLGKPVIATPVWRCQTAINLSNLTEGSDLRIFNPGSQGTETLFANTFQEVDLSLVAPLQTGQLTAQQYFRRCPGTAASPIESVNVPGAHPLPTPGLLYAPFTGYTQLIVSNVVSGEILSVSRVVEGGGTPQLLGEQMATWDPATVNLPPFAATDPSGGQVSLLVKGTLCDNAAASASIGAPATPPASLGGNTQYIFWGGLGGGDDYQPIPVLDLVVEITITEEIVVSPTSGVTPATPNALPIGFQINGLPPRGDTQKGQQTRDWRPTAGDVAIGAVQYGVKMWPDTNHLISFAEYWPPSLSPPNTFNLSTPTPVTLPSDLTIPAGWTIRFKFTQQSNGTITGFDCTVTDVVNGESVSVEPDMGINFLAPQNQLAAGGPIGLANLSQLVAFQVVLVGFWSSADATLLSGAGTITCTSSTPLIAQNSWPPDSGSLQTVENTNSTYGLLPPGPSKSFTQTFGVT